MKKRTSELQLDKGDRKSIKLLPVHLEDQGEFPRNYLQSQHELSLLQYPVPVQLRISSKQDRQQTSLKKKKTKKLQIPFHLPNVLSYDPREAEIGEGLISCSQHSPQK